MLTNFYFRIAVLFILLLLVELGYFKIAEHFGIVDKPNSRSSHSSDVIRGGGIIFTIAVIMWLCLKYFDGDMSIVSDYKLFTLGLVFVAGASFIDDIHSLPDTVRLVAQFIGMLLMFYQLNILDMEIWWVVIIALIVFVGATNIINFMDGINGITGAYTMAALIPLVIVDGNPFYEGVVPCFVNKTLIYTVIFADIVFCIFNFRPKGKAKCFAGDVGSIGVAFILLFIIGKLIMTAHDPTYLIFLVVYGIDGVFTICHRIMLGENIGVAHRKHAFQLMSNELKMSHITVSLIYALLQLVISLVFIFALPPENIIAHTIYLVCVVVVLAVAYLLFMKKYYHLHEEYLASLKG